MKNKRVQKYLKLSIFKEDTSIHITKDYKKQKKFTMNKKVSIFEYPFLHQKNPFEINKVQTILPTTKTNKI